MEMMKKIKLLSFVALFIGQLFIGQIYADTDLPIPAAVDETVRHLPPAVDRHAANRQHVRQLQFAADRPAEDEQAITNTLTRAEYLDALLAVLEP